jgi:hypothetical protein
MLQTGSAPDRGMRARGAGELKPPDPWCACQVPTTYLWSPSLLPRPSDWSDEITVVGFVPGDADEAAAYKPSPQLEAFLAAGVHPRAATPWPGAEARSQCDASVVKLAIPA